MSVYDNLCQNKDFRHGLLLHDVSSARLDPGKQKNHKQVEDLLIVS